MSEPVIQIDGLWKKFRRGEAHDTLRDLIPAATRKILGRASADDTLQESEFWALQDVSARITRGEAVGVIGHNGAGKSTLLKHLTGLLRPTRGQLTMRGRVSALIEIGAGFHLDLTGRENIFLNGAILGMSVADVRRKFDQIVDFSGLEEFLDTPVKRYSSGMFAKLGFSVAAHLDPDILLIDEVLSVGDFTFQKKGVEKMISVANSGTTVVFVSHNLKSVSDLCKRVLLFSKGKLISDGPTDVVIHDYMALATRTSGGQANEIEFESVTVRGEQGPQTVYAPGDRVFIDVVARALRPTKNLELNFRLFDHAYYELFNVSTERLGLASFALSEGERLEVTISTVLHLLSGTYQLSVSAWRMDLLKSVDALMSAASIHVQAKLESRGIVNPYASVETCRVHAAGTSLQSAAG